MTGRFSAPRRAFSKWLFAVFVVILLGSLWLSPKTTRAAVQLSLPIPPGETWRVLQGYGCGTHDGWDKYSLDLAQVNGPTYGAPIHAAADGNVLAWVPASGTLILSHGEDLYTMYTHLQSAVETRSGAQLRRGQVIGAAGDRGAPGVPHLHFTAFTAEGGWGNQRRQSIPLSFLEGYTFPDIGGCNQYGGTQISAPALTLPEVQFRGPAIGRWYNTDQRIEFALRGADGGFTQGWGREPARDRPAFGPGGAGYMQLSWAGEGMFMFYVRAWNVGGQHVLTSYGPLGYDITPPQVSASATRLQLPAGQSAPVVWDAASDTLSGVSSYRVYLGPDAQGSGSWFVDAPEIVAPPLAAGSYVLRVQAFDRAGNRSEWVTVAEVQVR